MLYSINGKMEFSNETKKNYMRFGAEVTKKFKS